MLAQDPTRVKQLPRIAMRQIIVKRIAVVRNAESTPIMHESTRALNGSYSKINRLDGFGRKHLEART